MEMLHTIEVRGRRHEWMIRAHITTASAAEMRADGLKVWEVVNVIPAWVAELGLARPWMFVQDLLNLRNPFKP